MDARFNIGDVIGLGAAGEPAEIISIRLASAADRSFDQADRYCWIGDGRCPAEPASKVLL